MATNSEKKKSLLGNIAAAQTLTERYPILASADIDTNGNKINTSIGLMLNILQLLNVDNTEVVRWAADLISSDGENGLLDTLETSIKVALEANISNVLNCTTNPIIPDELLDAHTVNLTNGTNVESTTAEGAGFEINLNCIDYMGLLNLSPDDAIGKYYFFNTKDYNVNQYYKSQDFNAFLWYVIHKGSMGNTEEKCKMRWDNRNTKKIKKMSQSDQNSFFNAIYNDRDLPSSSVSDFTKLSDYNKTHKPVKKQIIQCQFLERSFPNSNVLKVQLCSSEYYKKRSLISKDDTLLMNKTIFEFNHDFIWSLKLWDTKVMVAQIVNKLTSNFSVGIGLTVNEIVAQKQIDTIVNKMVSSEDVDYKECFFTFSNQEYDRLLNEAELAHAHLLKLNENESSIINSENILDSLNSINEDSTLEETTTTVTNILETISKNIDQNRTSSDDKMNISLNFSGMEDIITMLLREIISGAISAILSPKVLILLLINEQVMGKLDEKVTNISDILKSMFNLIFAIIKEIKDLILTELFNFLMKKLKPLLELLASKLALETVQMYKEIITSIIEACFLGWNTGRHTPGTLDNVDYSDIIPSASAGGDGSNGNC